MIAGLALAAALSSLELGLAEGRCRSPEPGPAVIVQAVGLKDRSGRLRLELYPNNDADFLADDTRLIAAGKTFARVDVPIPPAGVVELCIRAPAPGRYALLLLHDRNGNRRFNMASDGIGFPGNPRLGWSKPKAETASLSVGTGVAHIAVVLNYRHGLSMRPEKGT
jgi:uncharacterized protein (DUF2141 family)